MQFRFVTSMSRKQFDEYGQDMLRGLVQFWPDGEKLCYSEDTLPPVDGITHKSVWDVPGAELFLKTTGVFPVMRGEIGEQKHYTKDAHNFSKKVFSIIGAATDYPGYLFWVDADVNTNNFIPPAKLEEWMLGNFACVMKRKTWHLCSSFMGFDCTHSFANGFFNHLFHIYMTGTVFLLPQWDDAFVIEQVLQGVLGVKDISENFTGEGPYNVFDMVFAGYASHSKGVAKLAMRYEQLIQLVRNTQPKRVIEIGTWKGLRAMQMAAASQGMKYFGFDYFEDGSEELDKAEKNAKKRRTLDEVSASLKTAGVWHKLYKGDSKQTFPAYFKEYGPGSADLIFIDGGHSAETIKSDLENARRAIKKGGLIILDDFYTEMPEEELKQYGCQSVLEGMEYNLLPVKDWVQGGGRVQMALLQC